MPHSGGYLGAVLFDLHPATAAVAELPPRQIPVQIVLDEFEPSGHAFDNRCEGGSMRLSSRGEAKAGHAVNLQAPPRRAGYWPESAKNCWKLDR